MAWISVKLIATKVYIHVFSRIHPYTVNVCKTFFSGYVWKIKNKNFHMYEYLFHPRYIYVNDNTYASLPLEVEHFSKGNYCYHLCNAKLFKRINHLVSNEVKWKQKEINTYTLNSLPWIGLLMAVRLCFQS